MSSGEKKSAPILSLNLNRENTPPKSSPPPPAKGLVLEQSDHLDLGPGHSSQDPEPEQVSTSGIKGKISQIPVNLLSSFKLKVGIVVIVLAAIVYLIVGTPLVKEISSGVGSESVPEVTEPEIAPNPTTPEGWHEKLKSEYPGFEVIRNDGAQQFVLMQRDGAETHEIIVSFNGEVISDEIKSANGNPITAENAPSMPTNPIVDDGGKVEIPKSDYEKSYLSLPTQNIDPSQADLNIEPGKMIVAYEKLPIKGSIPYIFATVIDTGEKIIFPVKYEEYTSLQDFGTTVIQADVVKTNGVVIYENVALVPWNQ